jgi:hypothetical protein
MKLTAAEKRKNKVEKMATRLAAMAPQNRINDVAKVFQKIVRIRAADKTGHVRCVTCGKERLWNDPDMNAGHYISKTRHATAFHFTNCHPQCAACNDRKRRGNKSAEYERYMLERFGEEVVADLKRCAAETVKWTCEELAEKKIQLGEMLKKTMSDRPMLTTAKPATETGSKRR